MLKSQIDQISGIFDKCNKSSDDLKGNNEKGWGLDMMVVTKDNYLQLLELVSTLKHDLEIEHSQKKDSVKANILKSKIDQILGIFVSSFLEVLSNIQLIRDELLIE